MRNVSRLVDLNSAGSALNWPSHSGLISSSGSQLGLGVQIARYARSFWSSASNVSTLCSKEGTVTDGGVPTSCKAARRAERAQLLPPSDRSSKSPARTYLDGL